MQSLPSPSLCVCFEEKLSLLCLRPLDRPLIEFVSTKKGKRESIQLFLLLFLTGKDVHFIDGNRDVFHLRRRKWTGGENPLGEKKSLPLKEWWIELMMMKKKQNKDNKTYFACVPQKMNHFFTLKLAKYHRKQQKNTHLKWNRRQSKRRRSSCLSNKKMRKIKRILYTSQPGTKLLNSSNYFQVVFHWHWHLFNLTV